MAYTPAFPKPRFQNMKLLAKRTKKKKRKKSNHMPLRHFIKQVECIVKTPKILNPITQQCQKTIHMYVCIEIYEHVILQYPCVSDFENEIDQWDSFGNGTRGGSHVRTIPASYWSFVLGCFCYCAAY